MMHGYNYGFGWFGFILMIILSLALIVAVIIGAIWLGGRPRPGVTETPLEILKKRYAGGEISKEEYERMKQELS